MTDQAYTATAEETRQFVERIERLEMDRQAIAESMKDLLAEAKARGFDTKVLRKAVALRKMAPDDRAEADALLDMYLTALGMV